VGQRFVSGLGCADVAQNRLWAAPRQNREHVAKTSLFCAFEISPHENLVTEVTAVFLKRHCGVFAISWSDIESTGARIQTDNFVRPHLAESVGILFELPTPREWQEVTAAASQ
jgi:hypothetical protein